MSDLKSVSEPSMSRSSRAPCGGSSESARAPLPSFPSPAAYFPNVRSFLCYETKLMVGHNRPAACILHFLFSLSPRIQSVLIVATTSSVQLTQCIQPVTQYINDHIMECTLALNVHHYCHRSCHQIVIKF